MESKLSNIEDKLINMEDKIDKLDHKINAILNQIISNNNSSGESTSKSKTTTKQGDKEKPAVNSKLRIKQVFSQNENDLSDIDKNFKNQILSNTSKKIKKIVEGIDADDWTQPLTSEQIDNLYNGLKNDKECLAFLRDINKNT